MTGAGAACQPPAPDLTKKLTKVSSKDTNNSVGDSPKPPVDTSWDDVDQAFFASAPPDVPQPAPEPERFDDLFPDLPVEEKREAPVALRRAAAAATATRASLRRAWLNVGRGARPAIAAAGRQAARLTTATWRQSARAFGSAGRATTRALRTVRPAVGRLVGRLRVPRVNGQAVAIALASVMLIMGLSAVVVASRSSARANLPAAPTLERRASSADGTLVASAAPPAALPFAPEQEQPMQSLLHDSESPVRTSVHPAEPAHAHPAGEPTHHAEVTKRAPAPAHKHHRPATYSAEKDLIVPSFMQPAAQAPSAPRPVAQPRFASPRPAPPPARPIFSR